MKKMIVISTVLFISACGQQECKKPLNPNGDSELALLMREMSDNGFELKKQIENGIKPTGLKRFETIHSATPTDPKVTGPVFRSFATAYVESLKQLETSDSASVFRFNKMVDQCMNCHTEFCPGPKKRIKQLYISE